MPPLRRPCGYSRALRLQTQKCRNRKHDLPERPSKEISKRSERHQTHCRGWRPSAETLDPNTGNRDRRCHCGNRIVHHQTILTATEPSGGNLWGSLVEIKGLAWECKLDPAIIKGLHNLKIDILLGIKSNYVVPCLNVINNLKI